MTPSNQAPPRGASAGPAFRDNPQPPPVRSEGSDATPVPRAPGDKPCCCKSITLKLARIHIVRLTDAGDIFLISKLAGNAPDHVFVRATDCKGKAEKVPDDPDGYKLDAGQSAAPYAVLATILPDADCNVDCTVRILVHKESVFNRILDDIASIKAELEAAVAKLAGDIQTLQSLLRLSGPQGAAISSAIAAIASDQERIRTLNDLLARLVKDLAGTRDTLMLDYTVQFKGSLACDADMVDAILESGPWVQDPANKKRATIKVSTGLMLGGEWEFEFVAVKDCPPK